MSTPVFRDLQPGQRHPRRHQRGADRVHHSRGITTSIGERAFDAIVFATGFDVDWLGQLLRYAAHHGIATIEVADNGYEGFTLAGGTPAGLESRSPDR